MNDVGLVRSTFVRRVSSMLNQAIRNRKKEMVDHPLHQSQTVIQSERKIGSHPEIYSLLYLYANWSNIYHLKCLKEEDLAGYSLALMFSGEKKERYNIIMEKIAVYVVSPLRV